MIVGKESSMGIGIMEAQGERLKPLWGGFFEPGESMSACFQLLAVLSIPTLAAQVSP